MKNLSDLLLGQQLTEPHLEAARAVRHRADSVLRPVGAFSRLDEIAVWLAEWQGTPTPSINRPRALVFAADHGVTDEKVSAYPATITRSMLEALEKGVATASVLASALGVSLDVIDVGVGRPTGNIALEPALDSRRFEEAIRVGIAAVRAAECDLLVLGEMGIGNTTAAAAVAMGLFGGNASDWVGPGTGLDGSGVARKTRVVERAVRRLGEASPSEILRQLGGSELAAIAGAALEARRRRIPILLDGYVATAALMPLEIERSGALDHCWPAHVSAEPGHRLLLAHLGRRPILDLDMRLGEGSGALMALPIVRLAAAAVSEVATFDEWVRA